MVINVIKRMVINVYITAFHYIEPTKIPHVKNLWVSLWSGYIRVHTDYRININSKRLNRIGMRNRAVELEQKNLSSQSVCTNLNLKLFAIDANFKNNSKVCHKNG